MFYRNVMMLVIGMLIIPGMSFSQQELKVQKQGKRLPVEFEEQKQRVRVYGEERYRDSEFDRRIGKELREQQVDGYYVIGLVVFEENYGIAEFSRMNRGVVERMTLRVNKNLLVFALDALRKRVKVQVNSKDGTIESIKFFGVFGRHPVVSPKPDPSYREGRVEYDPEEEGRVEYGREKKFGEPVDIEREFQE